MVAVSDLTPSELGRALGKLGAAATRKRWARLREYEAFFASSKIYQGLFEDYLKERSIMGADARAD